MKNSLFDYTSYKTFLKDWIGSRPQGGHGQMSRIAKHLDISSVSVSHVFNGERNFSEEQAVELGEFLGLTDVEADFFLLLVQFARAGSKKLESKIDKQLHKARSQAKDLKNRVPSHGEMDESAKATFYSNWYYSGIRLLTDIDEYGDLDSIATQIGLSRARTSQVLEFLLKHGLCVEKNGRVSMGQRRTHVEASSPLAATHHRNWRLKAFDRLESIGADELFFTGPMTLSHQTLSEIRKELTDLLARVTKMIEPSKGEVLACMNFDLFKV